MKKSKLFAVLAILISAAFFGYATFENHSCCAKNDLLLMNADALCQLAPGDYATLPSHWDRYYNDSGTGLHICICYSGVTFKACKTHGWESGWSGACPYIVIF
ncbi:MAG: hypothetical protein IJS20_01080 [Bacteroidales bacterium]|nr:hypothetical protein [Bacteroidales bacterium]